MYQKTSCRICGDRVLPVLDLGETALANAFTDTAEAARALPKHQLELQFCEECRYAQLSVAVDARELFGGSYLYATPPNKTLHDHYDVVLRMLDRVGAFGPHCVAMEMGSNNGEFMAALAPRCMRVVGVEPAANLADIARERGFEVETAFFGHQFAGDWGGLIDLFVARHCLAHLDDVYDIMSGIKWALARDGTFYGENAYLLDTIEEAQLDQIYHEHMSYLSVTAVERLLRRSGLMLIHVERAALHGGALLYVGASVRDKRNPDGSVAAALDEERRKLTKASMVAFAIRARNKARSVWEHAKIATESGGTVCVYGATAKSNTLIAASGIADKISYCVDESPLKIGKFLPGSGVPIVGRDHFLASPTSACILTAWNYADEIRAKESWYSGRFVMPGEAVT